MTSKKIIALILTACMLLSCLPAFAATVALDDVVFPEDGDISVVSIRTIWESIVVGESARDVLIILDPATSAKFPYRASANHYDGVTLSFTATCKNEVMADGITTFTVVDAPAGFTRADGGGNACFGVAIDDLIKYSPELSALDGSKFAYTMQESPFTITNLFVGKGTWEPGSVSTGAFPEGTVFLSYQGFLQYPSAYEITSGYGYTDLIYKNTRTTPGPYQFFVPETTGEYNVYVQLVSNNGSLGERAVKLSVDGKEMNFKPGDYETSKLPTSMVPMWCDETADKTVVLTKDKVVAVQLQGMAYGRITAVAFVPKASSAGIAAAISESPTTVQLTAGDIVTVAAKAYHPDFYGDAITVTFNGEEMTTRAGMAAKKFGGYYWDGGKNTRGLSVRILPETNTFPEYVTVLDAVAKYMQLAEKASIYTASSIHDGKIDGRGVIVNGVSVSDIDWYEIKDGDVIEIVPVDKNTFAPAPVRGFKTIDTGNAGLISALGTPTSTTPTELKGGHIKLCFDPANATNAIGTFATNLDETGLKDCYLVGYLTMRKDNTSAGGSWTNLDPTAKVYLENVPILGYNKDSSGALVQGSGRIDLVTGGNFGHSAQDPRYKNPAGEPVQNAAGKWLVKPNYFHADNYLYNWSNVYIVNAKTDLSLKVKKGTDKYTLTTGGMHVVDVLIATYSEDGQYLTGTELKKEQIVMFNAPLEIPVAANQKAFVWDTEIYEGTTMAPAVNVMLGSNFAD